MQTECSFLHRFVFQLGRGQDSLQQLKVVALPRCAMGWSVLFDCGMLFLLKCC